MKHRNEEGRKVPCVMVLMLTHENDEDAADTLTCVGCPRMVKRATRK